MHCGNCGTALDGSAAYCPECGAAIDADQGGASAEADRAGAGQTPRNEATAGRQRPSRSTGTGWATTRILTVLAAGVAAASTFLPWYTAVGERLSANGLSTELGPFALGIAVVALVPPLLGWGRGFGRLAPVVAGLAGLGIAGVGFVSFAVGDATMTMARIEIDGQLVPAAVLNPGVGLYVCIAAGGVVVLASIVGLVASFTS